MAFQHGIVFLTGSKCCNAAGSSSLASV